MEGKSPFTENSFSLAKTNPQDKQPKLHSQKTLGNFSAQKAKHFNRPYENGAEISINRR